jgi:phage repressor protein C with HTH and peptisase S24 domain
MVLSIYKIFEQERGKIMFAKNLKYLRERKGLEQIELAHMLNRKSSSSISEWEKGKYTPKLGVLNDISKIFKVDIDDLMNIDLSDSNFSKSALNIDLIFNQLEGERQNKVYNFAEEQLKEQNKIIQVNFNKEKLTKVEVALGVSAGVGYGNDYDLAEFTSFYTNEDIRNYDFALYVNGNSMEPKLHDGDIILLQETGNPDNGDIYAVLHDESLYVKQIHIEGDKFIMHSLNPKYGDITISLGEDIEPPKIIGKVVDSFTPMEVD